MEFIKTKIDGVFIMEPRIFKDERGYFFESFRAQEFQEKVCPTTFIQDNESLSCYGVVRGLHFQKPPFSQSKLIRVVKGSIMDVAVDLRKHSATYGQYVAVELSEENHRQLFIPRGFAHGFSVLSKEVILQYKCDNYYATKRRRHRMERSRLKHQLAYSSRPSNLIRKGYQTPATQRLHHRF